MAVRSIKLTSVQLRNNYLVERCRLRKEPPATAPCWSLSGYTRLQDYVATYLASTPTRDHRVHCYTISTQPRYSIRRYIYQTQHTLFYDDHAMPLAFAYAALPVLLGWHTQYTVVGSHSSYYHCCTSIYMRGIYWLYIYSYSNDIVGVDS